MATSQFRCPSRPAAAKERAASTDHGGRAMSFSVTKPAADGGISRAAACTSPDASATTRNTALSSHGENPACRASGASSYHAPKTAASQSTAAS